MPSKLSKSNFVAVITPTGMKSLQVTRPVNTELPWTSKLTLKPAPTFSCLSPTVRFTELTEVPIPTDPRAVL